MIRSLAVIALLLMASCSKRSPDALSTAHVYTAAEIRSEMGALAYVGDTAFAQLNSAALPQLYADFRSEIFRQGVTQWDERFDCNHFATYFAALAQTKFYLANFHSQTPARSLAVGTFWYIPQGAPALSPSNGHAIVVALTERGTVFLEPQTGAEITLTKAERDSAWLRAF